MTPEQVEAVAKSMEREAANRRAFAAKPGFDARAHSAAADAYQHSATLLRLALEES